MKIKVVNLRSDKAEMAVAELTAALSQFSAEQPSFLLVLFPKEAVAEDLRALLTAAYPDTVIAGIRCNHGTFGRDQLYGFSSNVSKDSSASPAPAKSRFSVKKFAEPQSPVSPIFVQAFYDAKGAFSCYARACQQSNDVCISDTLNILGSDADRAGVMPNLLLLFNTQGTTEGIKSEITNTLGISVSIIGGIVDNSSGPVTFFTRDRVVETGEGYLLVSMYTPCEIKLDYISEVKMVSCLGRVTSSHDLILNEIDNKPAADMFFSEAGIDSTGIEIEELERLLSSFNRDYFLAFNTCDFEEMSHYTVSVVNSITPNRGVVLNSHFHQGEKIFIMRATDEDMVGCFEVAPLDDYRITGVLHIMCESFCRGSKAVVFPNVVESVRKYHGDQEYLVYSAAGEIIGTTESEVKLENCTVCTVSFLEKDR